MLFERFFSLSPSSRRRRAASLSRRLSLETLEARDCPTQFSPGSVPIDLNAPYAAQQAGGSSGPVSLAIYSVTYGAGQSVSIFGDVSGWAPSGLIVEYEGAVQGTSPVDSDGTFNITTDASSLDNVLIGVVDPSAQYLLSNIVPSMLSDSGPAIQNFAVNNVGGTSWQFSGQVVGNYAAGLTVNLGGDPVSLQSVTATTAADGTFSAVVNLPQGASDVGYATAQVTDGWGMAAASGSVYVPYLGINQLVQTTSLPVDINAAYADQQSSTPPTPAMTLTMNVVYTDPGDVSISGAIAGATGSTLVEFTGPVTGYLETNADGTFNISLPVSSQDTLLAVAVDPNAGAAVSNVASATFVDNGPVIQNLTVTPLGGTTWVITGQVVDNIPGGLQVNFGGLQSLENQNTTTAADGTFYFQVSLVGGTYDVGFATAQVTDYWGMTSAPASTFVANNYVDQFLPLADAPVDLNAAFNQQADNGTSTVTVSGSGHGITEGSVTTTTNPLTVNYVSLGGGEVLVYGSLTGANAGGAMIEFEGPIQGFIITNPDGSFGFTTQTDSIDPLLASVIDPNTGAALDNVVSTAENNNPAPQIINFTYKQVDSTLYQFSGQVIATNPLGMVVTFGGAPQSLQGEDTTANSDGSFYLDVNLVHGLNDTGLAWAQVTDSDGNTSILAYTNVTLS